jgi:hypothetical protein
MRWTPQEDEQLARAVREHRGSPDKRSKNGIRWADIKRAVPTEYPLLARHLADPKGKTLSKRWCQYLCADDQMNKERIWR